MKDCRTKKNVFKDESAKDLQRDREALDSSLLRAVCVQESSTTEAPA